MKPCCVRILRLLESKTLVIKFDNDEQSSVRVEVSHRSSGFSTSLSNVKRKASAPLFFKTVNNAQGTKFFKFDAKEDSKNVEKHWVKFGQNIIFVAINIFSPAVALVWGS